MVGGTGERRERGEQGCVVNAEEDSVPVHMGKSTHFFSPLVHPQAQVLSGNPTLYGLEHTHITPEAVTDPGKATLNKTPAPGAHHGQTPGKASVPLQQRWWRCTQTSPHPGAQGWR